MYTPGMTLREALHVHIPTLGLESTVRDAVDKMDLYQFPALVVVDDDLAPVGVLTEGDVCRALETLGDLTCLGGEPAHAIATPHPVCGSPEDDVAETLAVMLAKGLTLLPVVESGRLCGIVLRVDLMHVLLEGSEAVPKR